MKNCIATWILILTAIGALLGLSPKAAAEEAALSFHTNIYDTYGAENSFSVLLGSTENGVPVEVDCGSGTRKEVELTPVTVDSETGSFGGILINCTVTAEGTVKIYGDPTKIDFVNVSGCYISDIDLSKLTELDFLDITHNELESLDLSNNAKLRALYVSDNAFSKEPFAPGAKPELIILEMNSVGDVSTDFDLRQYPKLLTFDAWHCLNLAKCDPTGCPDLMKLSIDNTAVSTLDVSKNPELQTLNIADTRITSIDLSNCPELTQLYASHLSGSTNPDCKFTSIDLSHNPKLYYLFLDGNLLTSVDLSNNPAVFDLGLRNNLLTSIDLSHNPHIYNLDLSYNYLSFATLPLDNFSSYYYKQYDIAVDKAIKVGTTIDFSDKVLREGTTTEAALYLYNENEPDTPTLVESDKYSYADGKITFKSVIADSVFVQFTNSEFTLYPMTTTKFVVKSEADYGKPSKMLTFTCNKYADEPIAFSIGVDGASAESPKTIYVDFGDGVQTPVEITTSELPSTPNVTGNAGNSTKAVYIAEGDMLSALGIDDIELYTIDVTKLAGMRHLSLTNTGLYSIDLQWNRCLRSLDLSGNKFQTLTLEGANGNYGKNVLSHINVSDNQLTEITLNSPLSIISLDLSNNRLTKLDFKDCDNMTDLNLSNNLLSSLSLYYGYSLKNADLSHNNISEFLLPETSVLEHLDLSYNDFTIATVPQCDAADYVYAPQSDYLIPTKGPGIDLSGLDRDIDGAHTQYRWVKADGSALTEGTDYTNNGGRFKFINTDAGNITCEMSHPALPAFTGDKVYKTTPIEAAEMPTHVLASFTTTEEQTGEISVASYNEGSTIYVDWEGTQDNLAQYMMSDSYRTFAVNSHAGVDVKVYTYDEDDDVKVFSLSGISLSKADFSNFGNLYTLGIYQAGTTDITFPTNISALAELSSEGNGFETFDLSPFTNLIYLALTDENLQSVDLSKAPSLQYVVLNNNKLTDIELGGNDKLWSLAMQYNQLTTLDFSEAPNLEQIFLSDNKISQIDVDGLAKLKVLHLDQNCLDFSTLPRVKDTYTQYVYSNQYPIIVEPVDGVVDLSSQADVDGTATVYRWFLGLPSLNEDGDDLVGEELVADTNFTIEDGVTTFLTSFHDEGEEVVCFMTNEELPDVYIYTNLFPVWGAGVENVAVEADVTIAAAAGAITVTASQAGMPVNVYAVNGSTVATGVTAEGVRAFPVKAGVYVVTAGGKACKVAVK